MEDSSHFKKTLTKSKHLTVKRAGLAERQLYAQAAEAKDWIAQVLEGKAPQPDASFEEADFKSFIDSLETGVRLCDLVAAVEKATPNYKPSAMNVHKAAKAGSFEARENVNFFLAASKAYGVRPITLFETEDLVGKKNTKQVDTSINMWF